MATEPAPVIPPTEVNPAPAGPNSVSSETHDRIYGVVAAIIALNVLWLVLDVLGAAQDWPSHRAAWSAFTQSLTDGFQGNTLLEHAAATLGRVLFALLVGGVAGVGIGTILSSNRRLRLLSDPFVSFMRMFSPAATLVITSLYIGIGESSTLVLASLPVGWFVADAVSRGRGSPGPRRASLATTARTALLVAWIVVAFAELLGSDKGLASAMWTARTFFRMDLLVVMAVVSTVMFLAIDYMIRFAFRR